MAEHAAIATSIQLYKQEKKDKLWSHKVDHSWICESQEDEELVSFNISGQVFIVTVSLLKKFPGSKLSDKEQLKPYWKEKLNAYFFERDPRQFNEILNLHRYGCVESQFTQSKFFQRELDFWQLRAELQSTDAWNENEMKLEEEFLKMESNIQPPNQASTRWQKTRYSIWCFLADPVGPGSRYPKLAVAYAFFTISVIILYMILFGLNTSPHYREAVNVDSASSSASNEPPSGNAPAGESSTALTAAKTGPELGGPSPGNPPASESTTPPNAQITAGPPLSNSTASKFPTTTIKAETAQPATRPPGNAPAGDSGSPTLSPSGGMSSPEKPTTVGGCEIKIDCFVNSQAVPWVRYGMSVISAFLLLDTFMRIIICPQKGVYFKSVINWLDLLATLVAIVRFALFLTETSGSTTSERVVTASIAMQCIQVLRILRILQYATLIDGLMIMMLTLKASVYELLILITYLLMAMFFFSTLVMFVELFSGTGEGIPDALIGYWWAIITMTTVGYGDYYPDSTAGYLVGFFCAITGVILTALPVAVIGTNFNIFWEHNKKRKTNKVKSLQLALNTIDVATPVTCK